MLVSPARIALQIHDMRSKPLRIAVSIPVILFVLWAIVLLGPTVEARVESREDSVAVLPRTGMWYHKFEVTVRPLVSPEAPQVAETEIDAERDVPVSTSSIMGGTVSAERITVRTSQIQHDTLRTGNRVRLHGLPLIPSVKWLVDESILLGAVRAIRARIAALQNPLSISPSPASISGLARVVSVHRISSRRAGASVGPTADIDLIVVEYWAQRLRTLVRSADAVDARSIGDLGPGQILQMHYDPRSPRAMRLDDGMRTHAQ